MAAKLRKIDEEKDKTAENNYRKTAKDILGHESYEFKAVGRNHVSMIDRDNDDAVELLKAPEGAYEAHFIALLLAEVSKGRYLTLCLDEPNKCMHPSQVERLRETMLQKVKEGGCIIIVSTHSRDIISFDTWENVYYFKRHEGEPKINLTLTSVPSDDCRYNDSFPRGGHTFRDMAVPGILERCLTLNSV